MQQSWKCNQFPFTSLMEYSRIIPNPQFNSNSLELTTIGRHSNLPCPVNTHFSHELLMKLSLYIHTVFFVAKVEVRQLIVQCGVESGLVYMSRECQTEASLEHRLIYYRQPTCRTYYHRLVMAHMTHFMGRVNLGGFTWNCSWPGWWWFF